MKFRLIKEFFDEVHKEAKRRGISDKEYYDELMVQYNDILMKKNIDNIKDTIELSRTKGVNYFSLGRYMEGDYRLEDDTLDETIGTDKCLAEEWIVSESDKEITGYALGECKRCGGFVMIAVSDLCLKCRSEDEDNED